MKRIKIYTCGAMKGVDYNKQMQWRSELENAIRIRLKDKVEIVYVHPPLLYNYENKLHKSEAEIKEYELNQVRDSDIVVVDLDGIEKSIGAHYELSYVDAINSFGNKHIYVIGIGSIDGIHPWIALSLMRVEKNIGSAAEYITKYLLK